MKPRRLSKAEQKSVTVSISALGREGEGLAVHDGMRIYIPGALTGETVAVTLTDQIDRQVFRATLDAVLTPSPERIDAPCPHYDQCGGCTLQHVGPAAYAAWKTEQLRQLLSKAGVAVGQWEDPVFIPQATRRRAHFAVLKNGNDLRVGFHGRRSHRLSAIDRCLVMTQPVLSLAEASRPWLAKLLKDGMQAGLFCQVVDGQADILLTGPLQAKGQALMERTAGWANDLNLNRLCWRLSERNDPETMLQIRPVLAQFGRLRISLPAGAFLQPSAEGEKALAVALKSFLDRADMKKGPVADLFAGCGTFAGHLLGRGAVHAVEFDPAAVQALNAAKSGLPLTVEKRNLFTDPLGAPELKKFSAVVLDPPRAGAAAQSVALAASDVPAVIYISCSPSSFARDAAVLQGGGYRVRALRLVDQFTWSAHSELVALLTKG